MRRDGMTMEGADATQGAAGHDGDTAAGTLTPRQRRFIEEYMVDLNGTQAAIRAGYAPGGARQHASRLLAQAPVQAALAQAMSERRKRTELTADEVIGDLRELRDICMGRKPVKVMTIVKNAREGTAEPVEVEKPAPRETQPRESEQDDASGVTYYKVQFMALPRKLPAGSKEFKGLSPVECYKEGGMYKYTYGKSTDRNGIQQQYKKVKSLFRDAFIIQFRDGKRVK